jgi:hypothetical protein
MEKRLKSQGFVEGFGDPLSQSMQLFHPQESKNCSINRGGEPMRSVPPA